MTNDPRSESEHDNQVISNTYGEFCSFGRALGGSKHAREAFRVSNIPPPLFVSLTRVMNENLLQRPLAASSRRVCGGGNIP